jgi:hypothetical protein
LAKEYFFEIEQVLVPYNPETLLKWRQGDPTVVPPDVLNWKGPGRENGYGFAEYIVESHLVEMGFQVIVHKFDLFPRKKSKFEKNNAIIAEALGKEEYNCLQKAFGIIKDNKIGIEMPDICVIRPEFHFIEVKRDKDKLRPPQIVFAATVSATLGIKFRLYKVLPVGTICDTSTLCIKQELPDEIFMLK